MGAEEATLPLARGRGTFQAPVPQTDEPLKSPSMDTGGASGMVFMHPMNLSGQPTEQRGETSPRFFDARRREFDGLLTLEDRKNRF